MARDDILDHVYDNTNWIKKNTCRDKKTGTKKRHYIYIVRVLCSLSLLTNVVLVCLCFTKVAKTFLPCELVRNCSNSEGKPRCKYEKELLNYCPDLPEQWVKGNGSLYVFSSYNQTWTSSRQHCKSYMGDLVIINDTEEKEFLAQRLCVTGESNLYWTGTSVRNWEGQEQVNCATLQGHTQRDASCQREEKSICEIPCLQQ